MPRRTEVKSPVVEFYSRAFRGRRQDYLFGIERFTDEDCLYMNEGMYSVPDGAIRRVSVDGSGIWHVTFAPEARYVGIRDRAVCINYPRHDQIQFDTSSVRAVRRRHDGKLLWQGRKTKSGS